MIKEFEPKPLYPYQIADCVFYEREYNVTPCSNSGAIKAVEKGSLSFLFNDGEECIVKDFTIKYYDINGNEIDQEIGSKYYKQNGEEISIKGYPTTNDILNYLDKNKEE